MKTPEEWAEVVPEFLDDLRQKVAVAIREAKVEAVAAEREACAMIADGATFAQLPYDKVCGKIASLIRARVTA